MQPIQPVRPCPVMHHVGQMGMQRKGYVRGGIGGGTLHRKAAFGDKLFSVYYKAELHLLWLRARFPRLCDTKTCMPDVKKKTGEKFERAVEIMARLRAPGGGPWDREQTFDSIKPYTLEETYEVLEAIDNRDWDELTGELGDLLLQVLFYSEMAQEEKHFSIADVLDRLSNKLVNRHPHVFGDVEANTSADVLRNWEAIKTQEKKKRLEAGGGKSAKPDENPDSVLAGVSKGVPALLEAFKLSSRAAHVGFEWPDVRELFDKL